MRFRNVRKLPKRGLIACVAAAALFLVAVIVFAVHCRTVQAHFQPSVQSATGRNIAGYARPEDDTFLTYAEWYIVWSYQEKAVWQQTHLPSEFPYYKAIEQYWSAYCCSYSVVRGKYPFNFGDHLMLVVIGTSFTVEYALKGAYEDTVGRVSEWLGGGKLTEEDCYAANVAQDYGVFVMERPFYEYKFLRAFRGLWSSTKLWGAHPVRKWERKAWLSLDYLVESAYCSLIEFASHATYGVEEDVTYIEVQNLKAVPGSQIVKMPRYQSFTAAATRLLASPARFVTIAGNRQIMVTAVVPRSWTFTLPVGEFLFSLDILTDPQSKRVAIRVPVDKLDQITGLMAIEHIYDY
jgi:hypothetical protein